MRVCRLGFLIFKLCDIIVMGASEKTFKWDVAKIKLKLIVLSFRICVLQTNYAFKFILMHIYNEYYRESALKSLLI